MSAQEITAELSALTSEELQQVKAKLEELTMPRGSWQKSVWEVLRSFAGTAEGLPPDLSENHDHYLYGVAKRLLTPSIY